jgi:glycosyltransferase involved in cell wall biosynthesis
MSNQDASHLMEPMLEPIETDLLVASTRDLVAEERFDVLVHLLAQLADRMKLCVIGSGPDRQRVERLTAAYGIAHRLHFVEADSAEATILYPSARNAAAAPVQPEPGRRAVAFAGDEPLPNGVLRARTFAELISAVSRPDENAAASRSTDELLAGERVAVVTNIPAHYRIPLFNAVAQRLSRANAEFRVLFLARSSQSRAWMRSGEPEFDHEFVRAVELPIRENGLLVPIDLRKRLDRFQPSIVVAGGFSPLIATRSARYAAAAGVPFGIWSGEIASRPTARSAFRRRQRITLLRRASFALAYGFASGDSLRSIAPTMETVIVRNAPPVDTRRHVRPSRGTKEILTVGRAFPGKALDVAIGAVRLLDRDDCRLTVIGDGPELPRLRSLAGTDRRISFAGSVPSDQILNSFRSADLFLFPSRYDIFGHVLVEAMGSGVATLVSQAPGAVDDLAVSGMNCIVVHDHEASTWAKALTQLLDDDALRRSLGERARRTIESRWTIEHSADAWIAGLRLAVLGRE